MPEMQGTERQVEAAERIKEKVLEEIDHLKSYVENITDSKWLLDRKFLNRVYASYNKELIEKRTAAKEARMAQGGDGTKEIPKQEMPQNGQNQAMGF